MNTLEQAQRTILRNHLRERCSCLTSLEREEAADFILRKLRFLPIFNHSQHIACYLDDGIEIPTQKIIEMIWKKGKSCYVPVIDEQKNKMTFALYTPESQLTKNRFGISEIVVTPETVFCTPMHLDLVLLPLVGFDSRGNRLGRGAGYYDKAFDFLHRRDAGLYDIDDDADAIEAAKTEAQHPQLWGLAYRCQQVGSLSAQPWDVPLQGVLAG